MRLQSTKGRYQNGNAVPLSGGNEREVQKPVQVIKYLKNGRDGRSHEASVILHQEPVNRKHLQIPAVF